MDEKSVLTFNLLNPTTFKKVNSDDSLKSTLYYDKTSNKLTEIEKDAIRVFNRNATNLKKDIDLKLPKDVILLVSVDKSVDYMLILTDNKKSRKIIVIDLKLEKVIFLFLEDFFEFLLGFFFINNNNTVQINTQNDNEIYFALVFIDEIILYSIIKDKRMVVKRETIIPSKKCFIRDYTYNSSFKILFCVLSDNTFDFYNLSNKKFFYKAFNISIPFIDIDKKNSIAFSNVNNAKKNIEVKKQIRDIYFGKDKYCQSQFFLTSLYGTLFFIILCYDDNKIHIMKVKTLDKIDEFKTINYEGNFNCSTLQFIDNLILLYNFIQNSFIVIDIKTKDIISSCYNINFPYKNRLFINGAIIEERNNQMIIDSLYNVNFDPKAYEENIWSKYEELKKKKKFYEALMILLNRKNSKEIFLHILHKLIINHPNIKAISDIYDEIIKHIYYSNSFALLDINNSNEKEEKGLELTAYELPKTSNNFVLNKKLTINQSDIFYILFKKYQEENLSQQQYFIIIVSMIIFVMKLIKRNIPIQKSFISILLSFMHKINNIDYLSDFYNFNYLSDSNELINYYLLMAKENENIKRFEQKALDISKRMKKFPFIIKYLFEKGKIYDGMMFFKSIYYQCTKEQIDEIMIIITKAKQQKEIKKILKYLY